MLQSNFHGKENEKKNMNEQNFNNEIKLKVEIIIITRIKFARENF